MLGLVFMLTKPQEQETLMHPFHMGFLGACLMAVVTNSNALQAQPRAVGVMGPEVAN